jgi:immune inhibitor A
MKMGRILVLLSLLIFISNLWSVPPKPETYENLKRSGRWEEVKDILRRAREKGVDRGNPERAAKLKESIKRRGKITQPSIVILVDFDDNIAQTPPLHYDSLLFTSNVYPTGSLRDYYQEVSYGQMDIIGDVTLWLRMPHSYSYYTNGQYGFGTYPQNAQGLVQDAVIAADPYVDFSQYDADGDGYVDALFVVHAGPGAEETGNPNHIWSHRWVTAYPILVDGVYVYDYSMEPENGKIGVFCHELGHVFGLPDLYDYDYDSEGLGNWSLMAGGSWGGGGNTPVHLDAWSRVFLGFVNPELVTSTLYDVEIYPVEENPQIYRLWTNGSIEDQYFLLENRRKIGFDVSIPAEGLLIYHIDDNVWGNNNQWYPGHTSSGHYQVALEQADGEWDLERNLNSGDGGDPYPGATSNRFFDGFSIPDSKDYNFQFTYVGVENIREMGDTIIATLFVSPVLKDVSPIEIITPERNVNVNESFNPTVLVMNRGEESQSFDVECRIDTSGVTIYSEIVNISSLSPYETTEVVFPEFTAGEPFELYEIEFITLLPQDEMPWNDTLREVFFTYTIVREVQSPLIQHGVICDGVINMDEWSEATLVDVSDFLSQGIFPGDAKLYIMHNPDTLFLALEVLKDSSNYGTDRWRIYFDDNCDGSFPPYGDDTEGELSLISGNSLILRYRPRYSNGWGSSSYPNFPAGVSTTYYASYELAIPFISNSTTPEGIQVNSPTDSAALFLLYSEATTGIMGRWPQDIGNDSILIPSLYAKIYFEGLNIGIYEEADGNVGKGVRIYPVPAGERIEIVLTLRRGQETEITIYDPTGRRVRDLLRGFLQRGVHRIYWNFKDEKGRGVGKGVYFVRILYGGNRFVRRVIRF